MSDIISRQLSDTLTMLLTQDECERLNTQACNAIWNFIQTVVNPMLSHQDKTVETDKDFITLIEDVIYTAVNESILAGSLSNALKSFVVRS